MPENKMSISVLREKYGNEKVFVVPHIYVSGTKDGFTKENHTPMIWGKYDTIGKYIFRYDAEGQPAFQQIIPYIIVFSPKTNKFLVSMRKPNSGESRLVGQMSIGFGGHVDISDGTKDVLFKALYRELHEELHVELTDPAKFVGYVRDMGSKTSDHFGCVFLIHADDASVKEVDKLEGSWLSIDDLETSYFHFESWSKYIIDHLVANRGKF